MGHMSGRDYDWTHTNASTMKMMANLAVRAEEEPELGFCGDIVAEFQEEDAAGQRTGSIRQLNLSAWTSQEASHKWYVENQAGRTPHPIPRPDGPHLT